jgi:uncharacterized protein YqeY
MKTVDEWKALLRSRLRVALGAKDRPALTVLRETLAAIDNAEAPPLRSAPTSEDGVFAGSLGGLGAGEVARLVLTPEVVVAIVEREIRERREAAAEYVRLGRHAEADVLALQADVLVALGAEPS